MPKYIVEVTERRTYEVEVEARNHAEAGDLALLRADYRLITSNKHADVIEEVRP